MNLSYAHPSSCALKENNPHYIGFMTWVWPALAHPVSEPQPFPWRG